MRAVASARRGPAHSGRRPQRGAARERRVVAQAAPESRVAHADRMRETSRCPDAWRMVRRRARADTFVGKGLYVVELSCGRLDGGRSRPQARSHLGLARVKGAGQRFPDSARRTELEATIRPRTGDGNAGG